MSQRLIHILLNEVSSSDLYERLNTTLDYLEEKNDPDPTELKIVESLNEAIEKLKMLESDIRNHLNKRKRHVGNKLTDLYDRKPTHVGTQNLFDI